MADLWILIVAGEALKILNESFGDDITTLHPSSATTSRQLNVAEPAACQNARFSPRRMTEVVEETDGDSIEADCTLYTLRHADKVSIQDSNSLTSTPLSSVSSWSLLAPSTVNIQTLSATRETSTRTRRSHGASSSGGRMQRDLNMPTANERYNPMLSKVIEVKEMDPAESLDALRGYLKARVAQV